MERKKKKKERERYEGTLENLELKHKKRISVCVRMSLLCFQYLNGVQIEFIARKHYYTAYCYLRYP